MLEPGAKSVSPMSRLLAYQPNWPPRPRNTRKLLSSWQAFLLVTCRIISHKIAQDSLRRFGKHIARARFRRNGTRLFIFQLPDLSISSRISRYQRLDEFLISHHKDARRMVVRLALMLL